MSYGKSINMQKAIKVFSNSTGKLFPPHIVILGYFFLVFIPLVLFKVVNIDMNISFIIIGLLLSLIFAFATSGIIVDYNKKVYKFYAGIAFLKLGKWESTQKIQKILFTKGKVGWAANYGRHFNVDVASKLHSVYLKINRKRNIVFSGSFDDAYRTAQNIAIALNMPIYTDQLIKNDRSVQIVTFAKND